MPNDATRTAIEQHQRALMRWPGVSRPITDECGTYTFDVKAADLVCDFFSDYLTHHKGEYNQKPFILADWQRELIIRPMFGWKRKDGLRRFRKVYLEVPMVG